MRANVTDRAIACERAAQVRATRAGMYKTEVIKLMGPWKSRQQLELATLRWVHWFNTMRLMEPIGHVPPAKKEANYWAEMANNRASTEALTL